MISRDKLAEMKKKVLSGEMTSAEYYAEIEKAGGVEKA
jgi:hypothetical protein